MPNVNSMNVSVCRNVLHAERLNARSDAEECHLDDQFWCVRIDSSSVWHALRQLRQKQSPGLDEVPARLLRLSAAIICEPLAAIFKSSEENRVLEKRYNSTGSQNCKQHAAEHQKVPPTALPTFEKRHPRSLRRSKHHE